MLLIPRRALAQVLTPVAINAQVKALNTRCGTAAKPLPLDKGVVDLWSKTLTDVARPGIGFSVGMLSRAMARLQSQQFNRTEGVPAVIYFGSSTTQDSEAYDEAAIYQAAVQYVMDQFPPNGIEQVGMGWTPNGFVVHCSPASLELVTLEAGAGATRLGFKAEYLLTVDDLRS